MKSTKVQFTGSDNHLLSARLEIPVDQAPHTFAIFAHCFTCTSNLTAVRNISRALNLHGIAVLRFDFTGLGASEGDFSETNFSTNIEDLLHAARFLEEHYQAPKLLIGHSLGGAAVLCTAQQLPTVQAIATIGAPFEPVHVAKLLEGGMAELEAKGEARISIGGRPFTIKRQFLDDLGNYDTRKSIRHLGRALLIMHSPQDKIVAIENAAEIYEAALHPKSFVSLDGADHLISRKEDSQYAGNVIANWASRYIDLPERAVFERRRDVAVRLQGEGFTTEMMVRHHAMTADEPESVGGNDFGPSPYELLSASLGACTAMTLKMYAGRKKWDLREVRVHLDHRKDYAADMTHMEEAQSKIDHFERLVEVEGDLNEQQLARLAEIADRCPVHRTLHSDVVVKTELKKLP